MSIFERIGRDIDALRDLIAGQTPTGGGLDDAFIESASGTLNQPGVPTAYFSIDPQFEVPPPGEGENAPTFFTLGQIVTIIYDFCISILTAIQTLYPQVQTLVSANRDTGWRVVDKTKGVNGSQTSLTFQMRRIGNVVYYLGGVYDSTPLDPEVFPEGFRPSGASSGNVDSLTIIGVNTNTGDSVGFYLYPEGNLDPVNTTSPVGYNFSGSFFTDNEWPDPLPGISLEEYNS